MNRAARRAARRRRPRIIGDVPADFPPAGLAAYSLPGFAALLPNVPFPDAQAAAAAAAALAGAVDPGAVASAASAALNQAAAQAGGSIDQSVAQNSTPAATAAQVAGLAGVAAKAASGQPLTQGDVYAGLIGACALVNPALGGAMATCIAFEMAFVAGLEAIFKAAGWLAHGSTWNPGVNPPSGPTDPAWLTPDPKFWRLDGSDILDGSFQGFAVPILRHNWEMTQNGRPGYLDLWLLVQQLATAWNGVHNPPGVSFGMLGGLGMPGYGWAPVSTVTIPPGQGFTAGTFKHQPDTLRVRGYLLNDVPQWSQGNDYIPPVPDSIKALVVNAGPSTVAAPPPIQQPGHL